MMYLFVATRNPNGDVEADARIASVLGVPLLRYTSDDDAARTLLPSGWSWSTTADGAIGCVDSPSRFCPCVSLVRHLHQVTQGTFTPKLSDMSDTQPGSSSHRQRRLRA